MIRSSLLAGAHRVAASIALTLSVATASAPTLAASQRTFVSTAGVDNPACSIVAPCRGFAAAIAATNAGGEVIVQDSGGYGPVTIAKSVSILAPAGVYAGISVFSGDGVTIATPATTDKVVLQGLVINSQGSSGSGIHFTGAGRLEVARTRISGFRFGGAGAGLNFAPEAGAGSLHAVDLALTDNSAGVFVADSPAVLERVDASSNSLAIHVFGAPTGGANVVVVDSVITQNFFGVYTSGTGAEVILLTLDRCNVSRSVESGVDIGNSSATYATITGSTIAQSPIGLQVGPTSTARLAGSTIAQNLTGIVANGVVESQGNNFIWGNTSNGPAPTVVGSK
jgi:hypothetical protein